MPAQSLSRSPPTPVRFSHSAKLLSEFSKYRRIIINSLFVYHAASDSLDREGSAQPCIPLGWLKVGIIERAQTRQRPNPTTRAGKDSRSGDSAVQQVWLSPTSINDVAEEAGLARATVTFIGKGKNTSLSLGCERFNSRSWNLAETGRPPKKGSAAGTNPCNGPGSVRRNLRHCSRHSQRP